MATRQDKNRATGPSGGQLSSSQVNFLAGQGRGTAAFSQAVNDISAISSSFTASGQRFKDISDRSSATAKLSAATVDFQKAIAGLKFDPDTHLTDLKDKADEIAAFHKQGVNSATSNIFDRGFLGLKTNALLRGAQRVGAFRVAGIQNDVSTTIRNSTIAIENDPTQFDNAKFALDSFISESGIPPEEAAKFRDNVSAGLVPATVTGFIKAGDPLGAREFLKRTDIGNISPGPTAALLRKIDKAFADSNVISNTRIKEKTVELINAVSKSLIPDEEIQNSIDSLTQSFSDACSGKNCVTKTGDFTHKLVVDIQTTLGKNSLTSASPEDRSAIVFALSTQQGSTGIEVFNNIRKFNGDYSSKIVTDNVEAYMLNPLFAEQQLKAQAEGRAFSEEHLLLIDAMNRKEGAPNGFLLTKRTAKRLATEFNNGTAQSNIDLFVKISLAKSLTGDVIHQIIKEGGNSLKINTINFAGDQNRFSQLSKFLRFPKAERDQALKDQGTSSEEVRDALLSKGNLFGEGGNADISEYLTANENGGLFNVFVLHAIGQTAGLGGEVVDQSDAINNTTKFIQESFSRFKFNGKDNFVFKGDVDVSESQITFLEAGLTVKAKALTGKFDPDVLKSLTLAVEGGSGRFKIDRGKVGGETHASTGLPKFSLTDIIDSGEKVVADNKEKQDIAKKNLSQDVSDTLDEVGVMLKDAGEGAIDGISAFAKSLFSDSDSLPELGQQVIPSFEKRKLTRAFTTLSQEINVVKEENVPLDNEPVDPIPSKALPIINFAETVLAKAQNSPETVTPEVRVSLSNVESVILDPPPLDLINFDAFKENVSEFGKDLRRLLNFNLTFTDVSGIEVTPLRDLKPKDTFPKGKDAEKVKDLARGVEVLNTGKLDPTNESEYTNDSFSKFSSATIFSRPDSKVPFNGKATVNDFFNSLVVFAQGTDFGAAMAFNLARVESDVGLNVGTGVSIGLSQAESGALRGVINKGGQFVGLNGTDILNSIDQVVQLENFLKVRSGKLTKSEDKEFIRLDSMPPNTRTEKETSALNFLTKVKNKSITSDEQKDFNSIERAVSSPSSLVSLINLFSEQTSEARSNLMKRKPSLQVFKNRIISQAYNGGSARMIVAIERTLNRPDFDSLTDNQITESITADAEFVPKLNILQDVVKSVGNFSNSRPIANAIVNNKKIATSESGDYTSRNDADFDKLANISEERYRKISEEFGAPVPQLKEIVKRFIPRLAARKGKVGVRQYADKTDSQELKRLIKEGK